MDGKGDSLINNISNLEETANSAKNISKKRQGHQRYMGSRHRMPKFNDVSLEFEMDKQLIISQGHMNRLLNVSASPQQSPNNSINETEINLEKKYKLPDLVNIPMQFGSSAMTRNLEGIDSS